MATANINGVEITGTPQEIKEFYDLMNAKQYKNTHLNIEEYHNMIDGLIEGNTEAFLAKKLKDKVHNSNSNAKVDENGDIYLDVMNPSETFKYYDPLGDIMNPVENIAASIKAHKLSSLNLNRGCRCDG